LGQFLKRRTVSVLRAESRHQGRPPVVGIVYLRRSTLKRIGIVWIVPVKPGDGVEMIGEIGKEPRSAGEVSVSDTGGLHETS